MATSEETCRIYPLNARLHFPAKIARVLALKCNLRNHLHKAYTSETPVEEFSILIETVIQPLRKSLDELWYHHRDEIWLNTYKPFGLEIIEMRYAAIRSRMETLQHRITRYWQHLQCIGTDSKSSSDKILGFPELDVEMPNEIFSGYGMDLVFDFSRSFTPSRALGTG